MRKTVLLAIFAAGCGGELDTFDVVSEEAGARPEASPPRGGVSYARDLQERVYGIHIEDAPHQKPKVVYSVRLRDLRSTEQLRVRGEVALSRCNRKDVAGLSGDSAVTPCDSADMQRSPYGYTPRFSAAFVLAASAKDASGKMLSRWTDTHCTEGQHHCALAIPEAVAQGLPDAAERFVNLVITADAGGANARSWDVMEVEQHHGALYVTRIAQGAGARVASERSDKLLATGTMGIDQTEDEGDQTQVRRVLYQVKLTGLRGGDVLDADAKMRVELVGNFTCDPLITAEVLVTADRDATKPTARHDGSLTVKNGRNCSDHSSDGCKYEESGALQLDATTPSTMWVSYVATAIRSCAAPHGRDQWRADPGDGFLGVTVRR